VLKGKDLGRKLELPTGQFESIPEEYKLIPRMVAMWSLVFRVTNLRFCGIRMNIVLTQQWKARRNVSK